MALPDALNEAMTVLLKPAPDGPRRTVTAKKLVRRVARVVRRHAQGAGLMQTRAGVEAANVRLDGLESTLNQIAPALAHGELEYAQLERTQTALAEISGTVEAQSQELGHVATLIEQLTVNQELLKAEFRALQATLGELGMAIAPGAGLGAAGLRIAELRERVNGLDRRLRTPPATNAASGPAGGSAATGHDAPAIHAPTSTLFDYVGFENRFRGDPRVVADTLWERYGARLAGSQPVVDLGCGQAQLLRRLRAEGVAARGIDSDPTSVAFARDDGLDVVEADALTWLDQQPEHSIGSLIATHVVEHLELDNLVQLLELAASRLVPGGLLIVETPNPASLIVLGNSYVLDPTHVRPLHPSLLTFLLEGAGFRDVRLGFFAEATDYHLPLITDSQAPDWSAPINVAFQQLNRVLFGAQDYAAFATTPTRSDQEPGPAAFTS